MSVDPFPPLIQEVLQAATITAGYNLNYYVQDSPQCSEWNNLPAVLIVPYSRDDVSYMAFANAKNNVWQYQCFLVQDTETVNAPRASVNDFVNIVVDQLMPVPNILKLAGAWMSRVTPSYDYDRGLFRRGLAVTVVRVDLSAIFQTTRTAD